VRNVSPKDFPGSMLKGRIVNGDQAVSNQFPYQVSIRAISDENVSVCGGSIISNEFILTAAHCTKAYKTFEIGFGSNFLQMPIFRMVSRSKLEYPGFDSKVLTNVRIIK
jgi:chymotrypsin